ncbi:MAG TPA: hypothetical protein VGP36_03635 [Mycobacteriales bacterium]|nr:hypothetical protein [Mycobacteriales bacterium]
MTGTGTIGKQLKDLETTAPPVTTTAPRPASSIPWPSKTWKIQSDYPNDGPLMLVPAGFFGNVLSSFTGTIGEITGGILGNAPAGRAVGDAASGLAKLLPFSIIPPTVAAQSAGPESARTGSSEALVVVPSAFLGGLLGGIGGNLLGGTVGRWLGDEQTGKAIGETVLTAVGGLLPFSVVPPSVAPAATSPQDAQIPQEPMVVVPAGFFGNLLHGVTSTIGDVVGGDAGQVIKSASPLLGLLPFQAVPPALAPQSAGPDGTAQPEDMVVVPAAFLGSLLSGLAGTVATTVGSAFGDAATGRKIGELAAPLLDLLPFHAVPPELAPQSTGPNGTPADPADQLMLVPAGLFSGLLGSLAGTLGGVVGGAFGDAGTGKQVGEVAGGLIKMLPFHVVAPQSAS